MKLLYFHQHFGTPAGSSGTRSYEMAQKLLRKGHQVIMVCGSYKGAVTGLNGPFHKGMRRGFTQGIEVIEFNLSYSNNDGFVKRGLTFLKFALKSIALTLSESYDLLFATSTPLTAAIPGIFARWFLGKRFVFEVRDLWPELPREMGVIKNPVVLALISFLEWSAYKSAHHLIGLSPGIVTGIQRLGIPATRVTLVPNGCDIGLFSDKTQTWRPEGVSETDLLALYAGTHGRANGLHALLDAAEILQRRRRQEIKIVLIGDGLLKKELMERASKQELKHVIFHDSVGKEHLTGLMASADIGLQILANVPVFYYGTSPNKFFDYISSGLPVLNNYPGWLASLIQAHHCGYAVPPENPEAFADALEDAADHREALQKMGEAALELAKQHFDRNHLAEQFVSCLEGARG